MRRTWMCGRGWLAPAALVVTVAALAAGCGREVKPDEIRIVVVPAREALAGFQTPETPPTSTGNTTRPNVNWPLPPYRLPGQPAKRHPEWAVAHARPWQYIVIHHSDTDVGNAASFDAYHRSRGWENGLGYDFVIGNGTRSRDGEIEVGPRWRSQLVGAHAGVALYNERGIGICLVGNFEKYRPTQRQLQACVELVDYLSRTYNIPRKNILRHKDVKDTKCPGRYFPFEALFRS